MIQKLNIAFFFRRYPLLLILLLTFSLASLNAQEPPPRPVRITPTSQYLSFGAFYNGPSGGSVIITPSGTRSSTGDVVLLGLGYFYSAARYEVHAHKGTVISILNGPNTILTGVPSGSMTMSVGASSPSSPFVSTVNFNVIIDLYIGGTLIVGGPAANPPGSYSGTFFITLVQE